MRDENLSSSVEESSGDRADVGSALLRERSHGPIAVRRARALPEEIRALRPRPACEGQARVELGFIAGCAGGSC